MAKKAPTLNDRVLQETEEAVNSTFSFLVDEEDDENLRLVKDEIMWSFDHLSILNHL